MNPSSFMRIPSCNFHCSSFTCFSKSPSSSSSAAGLHHSSSHLESENAPPSDSPLPSNNASDNPSPCDGNEIDGERVSPEVEIALRSCIRSGNGGDGGRRSVDKKRVQWMDKAGKQLVDIREFEASDSGDDDGELGGCLCVIA